MPGFRDLWRGGRRRAGRGEDEQAAGRGANGLERAEWPEREAGERPAYGGEDFRYRPEPGRHRYPEGLYSGVGREGAARAAAERDDEPEPAPRRNGRPPTSARRRDVRDFDAPDLDGRNFPDEQIGRPAFERDEDDHPDYDRDDRDRSVEGEIQERPSGTGRRFGGLPSGPHRGRGPRGYRRSDERIREDVCDRLTEDPEIDASDIEVLVAEGEVTLNGSVETRLIRRLAEDIADTVSGVTLVQNNLKIGQPGSATLSDEPLRADPGGGDPGLAGRRRT